MGMPPLQLLIAACALALAHGTYTNPVLGGDVPDPGVVYSPELSLWVASTTGCVAEGCFALHTSPNLVNWTASGYLFPAGSFPAWASTAGGLTAWAPEIHTLASGRFVAYFVSKDGRPGLPSTGQLVIGAAHSSGGALGPWVPLDAPLLTSPPGSCYGVIDPSYHLPQGSASPLLIFKTDGNSCGQPTGIYSVPLTPDGLNATGGAWQELIHNDAPWEGPLVEAPWVLHNATTGYFYLFFSGSVYDQPTYAIGVARSRTLGGPWAKHPGNPILHSQATNPRSVHYGPGHCAVVTLPAGSPTPHSSAIVYAAEQPPSGPQRNIMLDALVWDAQGWPSVQGGTPSTGSQPTPAEDAASSSSGGVCDVTAPPYSAPCDNVTDAAPHLQRALDDPACATVLIAAPLPCVSRALNLSAMSHRTLLIAPGSELAVWRHPGSYSTSAHNNMFLSATSGDGAWTGPLVQGFTLGGGGRIVGGGGAWWPLGQSVVRPRTLWLPNCSDILISNLTIVDSPAWNLGLRGNSVTVSSVRVESGQGCGGYGEAPNTDGVNFGGHGLRVLDLWVRNGDDCIPITTGNDGTTSDVLVQGAHCECGVSCRGCCV